MPTGDALLAAVALIAGILLKSLLDVIGSIGHRRLERNRLLAIAHYNVTAERGQRYTDMLLPTAGLSDEERLSQARKMSELHGENERASDSLRRAVIAARLLSTSKVATQINLRVDGTAVPMAEVFESLRRELEK
jgi:hypothetical protein